MKLAVEEVDVTGRNYVQEEGFPLLGLMTLRHARQNVGV